MTDFKSIEGQFLIAENELGDPNFVETVVLLVSHDPDGAFGLVLNRRTQFSLGEAAPTYHESPFGHMPLFLGGPVEQEYLFTLHSGLPEGKGSAYQKIVITGVVFEPRFDVVEKYILGASQDRPPLLKLFAGYSGWGPGQLERELEQKTWIVMPASADLVFHPKPEEGWKNALRRKGGIYWALAETGYKPSLN